MDLRGKRGSRDPMENQEHWVLLGKRVTSAYQVCLDTLEDKDKRVHLAFLERLVPPERKDEGVLPVNQGKEGREVRMELEGEEVHEGRLESREKRALLDKMAHQDLPVNRDLKDHREDKVNQEQEGPMVLQEKMDCLVILDREANQDSKAKMVLLGPQVLSDHRVNLVRLAQLEIEVIQVHQGHQESMVYPELPERKVPREILVHKVHRERVVLLVFRALEEAEEPLVQRVLRV